MVFFLVPMKTFRTQLAAYWPVWTGALVAAAAALILLAAFTTPEYRSTIQIFVKQRYTLTDSYTATKSAESVSRNLAEVIRTSVFFDQVVANSAINFTQLLEQDEADKRKAWKRKVETEVIPNTSQLKISAYDTDPETAKAIAQTDANVLILQGSEWHSSPDTITLKIVDSALTSTYPVRPNLPFSGLAAACIGAVAGSLFLFLRSSHPLRLHSKMLTAQLPAAAVLQATSLPRNPAPAPEKKSPPQTYQVISVSNFQEQIQRPSLHASRTVKTPPQLAASHSYSDSGSGI
jgi:capsular polysaccharide biosynthesis protein